MMSDRQTSVLVVEDETLVAMLLEDMLLDIGCHSVEVAAHLEDGIQKAKHDEFSFAILDVNLGGSQSFPIADILRQRGIPFFFATGYGIAGVLPPYRDAPILQKPFRFAELEAVIASLSPRH